MIPRANMYVPEFHIDLFVDCPTCDHTYSLGLAAPAEAVEVWCSRCGRPFMIEAPKEEAYERQG